MEISLVTVTDFINGVGFPIAVCIALMWFNKTSIEKQTLLLSELKDIIRNNTDIIKDLNNRINKG